MDVVAQWVRTTWTKQSRGGKPATVRNSAPVAFPLPDMRYPLIHEVRLDEHDGFAPRHCERDALLPEDQVLLTEDAGRLRVELVAIAFARPQRRQRPPAIWLERGQWVRWQINYRFSWPAAPEGAQNYRLDTLNLAYGPLSVHTFTSTPTRHVDERAHLR